MTSRSVATVKPLDEVATIERDAVAAADISPGTLYVGLEHIDSDGNFVGVKTVAAGELASNKFRFGRHHLLFGKLRPYLRKTARPEFEGICSTDILPILPGPGVDRDYLFHYLRHPKVVEQAVLLCSGANLPRLSPRDLGTFEVPIPSLAEQRRIANILDKANVIRRKRKETISLTGDLLRSVFLEIFGDPVTNPNGWPVKRLGDLLAFVTSGSRGWAQYYAEAGEMFLRIQNVRNDRLDLSDVAYVAAPDSAEARRTEARPGDVLLSITADLGRTAVVPPTLNRAFINQHLAILRPSRVNAEYLSAFLASPGGQRQIHGRNKGGVKAGLNFDDIRSIEVPMPPDAAQQSYALTKVQIREMERKYSRALNDDDSLFGALIARTFSDSAEGPC
jgi:type I restriction enzyme, S subunit